MENYVVLFILYFYIYLAKPDEPLSDLCRKTNKSKILSPLPY